MHTRPISPVVFLPAPPRLKDLSWYEVDQPDVVAAKRRLLVELGAEVPRALQMARSKSQAAIEAKIGSLDHHAQRTEHPLRAAAWDSVAADLTKPGEDGQAAFYMGHLSPDATLQPDGGISRSSWRMTAPRGSPPPCIWPAGRGPAAPAPPAGCAAGWTEALAGAGFAPSKPVVWVAEGLLMYLDRGQAQALLRQLAGALDGGAHAPHARTQRACRAAGAAGRQPLHAACCTAGLRSWAVRPGPARSAPHPAPPRRPCRAPLALPAAPRLRQSCRHRGACCWR